MSQCRAPNCASKDFEGCQIRENSGTCSIKGTVPGVASASAICHPKSISDSWSIDATKCVGEDQFECEENKGCAWTMGNDLKKKCELASSAPIGAKIVGICAYTGADAGTEGPGAEKFTACSGVVDVYNSTACDENENDCTYTHPNYSCGNKLYTQKNGKYDLIDPDTFGCDRTNCEYRAEKKVLEPGECVRNDGQGGDACSGFSIERCHNDVVCSWKPNDEGYCGYSRYIEYQLNELNNPKEGVDEISKLETSTNDVCLSIQNPGREECELKGCIWDIYGDRTEKNPYNTRGDMTDALPHYYDISTSGLCVKPITDNCMGYFCSRHSGVVEAEVNYDRPDGKCKATSGQENGCEATNTEIVGTKTPGLITYLPQNFPTGENNAYISRIDWNTGTETDETTKITSLNNLLGTMYNQNQNSTDLRKDPQTLFQGIYKDNCEYNMNYPSSENENENDYQYGYKTYDYDSDLCIDATGGALLTDPISGNLTTPSFYGNCRNQTFYHKDSGPASEYANAGDISDKNRCSIQIKQPIVDLFVDSTSQAVRDTTQTLRKSDYDRLRNAGTCSIPTHADMNACSTNTSLWRSDLKHNIYNTQHSTIYTEETQSDGQSLTVSIGSTNVPIDILEQTQRNVECRTKFYEIVEILKGLVGPSTVDGLKQIKGTTGTGTISITPDDNYHGFSIDGTGYYPKTTVGVSELYNHIRVKINEESYGAPMKAALQGLFGDILNIGDTELSFSNISETPVDINNSVLYGLGICSDGTTTTSSVCIADQFKTWTPDTSNIILSISKKLQLEYISEEEYSSEVARYLASLVVYEETCELKSGQIEPTAADCNTLDAAACAAEEKCQLREWNDSNINPLSCMYDPYGQEYIYYEDGRDTAFCTVQQNVITACAAIGDSTICEAEQDCTYNTDACVPRSALCTIPPTAIAAQALTEAAAGVMTTADPATAGFVVGDSVEVTSRGEDTCTMLGTHTVTEVDATTITVIPTAAVPVDGFNAAVGAVNDCQVERLVSGAAIAARPMTAVAAQALAAAAEGVMTTVTHPLIAGFAVGDSVEVTSRGENTCTMLGTHTVTAVDATTISVRPTAASPVGGFNAAVGAVDDCQVERLVYGTAIAAQALTAAAAGVMTTADPATAGFAVGDSVVVTTQGENTCTMLGTHTVTAVDATTIAVRPTTESPVDGFNAAVGAVDDCQVERPVSGSACFPGCEYRAVIPTHNKDLYMYQKLAEVLPVSLDQGSSVNDLIGTGSGANLIENISTKHRIKDIIYKPGKAIVTLQYQTSSGDVVEDDTPTDLRVDGDIQTIILGSIEETQPETEANTLIFHNSNSSLEATGFNKLFNGTKEYTYDNKSFKQYIGGIVEIEIDGVDPGCFSPEGMDTSGFCSRSGEIFTLPEAVNFVVSDGGNNRWMIKEVRLKDVPVDIYFEGDIDGLYKVNDIISIGDEGEGVINDIFNPNLKLSDANDSGKYQKISDVDIINNKITVENARRRGKYFIGRGDFEKYHYEEDPKNCVKSTGIATSVDDLSLTNIDVSDETCDLKNDLYDKCNLIEGECDIDDRCEWVSSYGCLPVDMDDIFTGRDPAASGLEDTNTTSELKCNESIGNKDYLMEKTVCPTEVGTSGQYHRQYEDKIRTSGEDSTNVGGAITLITSDSGGKYDISNVISDITTNITSLSLSESGILEDWRIRYLYWDDGNIRVDVGEGRITNHVYTVAPTTHEIQIQRNSSTNDVLESKKIYPLSIKPPNIDQSTLGIHTDLPAVDAGDAGNSFDITIKNYVRKKVSNLQPTEADATCTGTASDTEATPDCATAFSDAGDTTATSCPAGCTYAAGYTLQDIINLKLEADTKEKCDFYNGDWDYATCASDSVTGKNIRASDLCERTGFNFDEKTNVCKKELNVDSSLDYCTEKTSQPGQGENDEKVTWDAYNGGPTAVSEKYPCSVCGWKNDTKTCEALPRKNCTLLNKDECGSLIHRPGTTSVPSACEYYNHNMEPNEQDIRQSDFECSASSDVSSTNSTCSTYQTLETCDPQQAGLGDAGETGCEWQCPLAYGADHPGYTVTHQNEGTSLQKTILGEITRENYYSPNSISVECSPGYEVTNPNDTSLPKAQCVGNSNDSTVGNHSEILGFVGCVKKLKCQNSEFTPEILQIMFSNDSSSVPSEFLTFNELDQGKFPDVNGNFRCPLPSRIINDPDDKDGWLEEDCCTNIGLCTNNDIGIDVICPEEQVIKMTYYEGNPTLSPHQGTTPEECCETPPVPTITVPLDADYDQLMVDESKFKEDFITDIVGILNNSDDINVTITRDMIDIVAIESGSIVVTFKINKDQLGNVVLKEQLQKTLRSGITFKELSVVTKGDANFQEYDPAKQHDHYSKTFGIGVSNEELIISIIITISLCFFCLVVMGMLMK
jgi:hypothetical protein